MALLSPNPKIQFLDGNGNALAFGKVYTYGAGGTTPLVTYTDSTGFVSNTNPIILDAFGQTQIWLGNYSYKYVVKDFNDVLNYTIDNVSIGFGITISNDTSTDTTQYLAMTRGTTGNLTTQYVASTKLFFDPLKGVLNVSGLDIGRGANDIYSNQTLGTNSLKNNTTGAQNTATGYQALILNSSGSANSAHGYQALASNTTGSGNTAEGEQALYNLTTGNNNAAFGQSAGTDAVANLTTQSNYVVAGNASTANANIKVAWTVTSDERDKTNFAEVPHGLDFVCRLNPIAYQFNTSREDNTAVGATRYGFKAQDIIALEGKNPVIINAEDEDNLKYNETCLIPVLVKAIQDLKRELEQLKQNS
jgi:hypothetical protein